jgi:hypothetical protein
MVAVVRNRPVAVQSMVVVVQGRAVAVQDRKVVVGRAKGEPAALAVVVAAPSMETVVPDIGIVVQGTAIPKIRRVGL